MLSESIAKLVQYGITTGLTPECERNYTTNLLLDVFHEDDYEKPDNIEGHSFQTGICRTTQLLHQCGG